MGTYVNFYLLLDTGSNIIVGLDFDMNNTLLRTCIDYYAHVVKVRKRAKIRNRYNQAPNLTQDTNGKVTTSQLYITNESQEVSPFPAGDHKASINRRARKQYKKNKAEITQTVHERSTALERSLLEGLNRFHGAPTSPLVQIMWIKTHRCLVCMKDP